MADRKQISKKLRFDIFKRDNFSCQYCGAKTPNVVLEVDHIKPVKNGGTNDLNNLITSCFDCNRGKSCNELISLPKTLVDNTKILKEKKAQYAAYLKAVKDLKDLQDGTIDYVDNIFSEAFEGFCLTDKFRYTTVRNFIEKLGHVEVGNAMYKACAKINYDSEQALKYFCGICWNMINNREL